MTAPLRRFFLGLCVGSLALLAVGCAGLQVESDLREVYETERHLLYVACTRARDHLLVTSGGQPSEFLDDLRGSNGGES